MGGRQGYAHTGSEQQLRAELTGEMVKRLWDIFYWRQQQQQRSLYVCATKETV